MSLRKIFLRAGVFFLLLGGVWSVGLVPLVIHTNKAFSTHLTYEAEAKTLPSLPGVLEFGRFTEEHATRVIDTQGSFVELETTSHFYDFTSGKLIFNDASHMRVNRDTLLLEGSDVHAIFPHAAPQGDILVKQFSYFPDSGVLFRFKGEERLLGETTYRYDYQATELDWTGNYTFALPQGSRILANDSGAVWIEPATGTLIKHEELWEALVDGGPHDGTLVDVGKMWMSNDAILRQVFVAKNERRKHRLYEVVIPTFLLISGLLFVALGWRRKGA